MGIVSLPIIKDFQIIEVLHEGYRAEVVRAKRLSDDKTVVLKLIKPECVDESTLDRLHNEAALLQTIDSPYVIKCIDYISTPNTTVMVLENFDSRTLAQFIAQEPLNLELRIKIAAQIAEALGAIHQKNIMHKDIKPQNILIDSTHHVKIIDLSSSTSIAREAPQEIQANRLEGTLAYISPEQTGRMARLIDYRTDIYSLGATLYHLFTGSPPFTAQTPMELIHMHITQLPTPPNMVNPEIPTVLSDIILKCLEKNVEDRYKSAYGLLLDLQECHKAIHETGKILPFNPGENDFYDKFHAPLSLYGRDKELNAIQECLKKIWRGGLHLLQITGYSGIGKSSLVLEALKPAIQKHARFVHYKFDQFNRNVPNNAIATMIKTLIHQMLGQPSEVLTAWKNAILDAVGKNGQILIDLVPDVELVIGEQPPLDPLSPLESENRFNYVMNEFIKVLPRPESPLIIFFDDFQWVDEGTLKLFRYLLTNSTITHLLLIIAYRDNEISDLHPLPLLIKDLSSEGLPITHLSISSLEEDAVGQIINETFYPLPKIDLKHLTTLVQDKTHGNPFFVIQFLKYLYDEELIKFMPSTLSWAVEIEKTSAISISDNVIDFLLEKIKTVDPELVEFMKTCSLFGNKFDPRTLTAYQNIAHYMVLDRLKQALKEEFIIQTLGAGTNENKILYQFSHDRIQQVFYNLIDESKKPALHYELGECMLKLYKGNELHENLISIVNHLNFGIDLPLLKSQKQELLRLNIEAGIRAKEAQAFGAAIIYFRQASKLPEGHDWVDNYEMTYKVHENLAECLHYIGEVKDAETHFNACLENSRTVTEKVTTYTKLALISIQTGNFDHSFNYINKGFELLQYSFNFNPSKLTVIFRVIKLKIKSKLNSFEKVKNYPEAKDERFLLASALTSALVTAAYKGAKKFLAAEGILEALDSLYKSQTVSAAGIQASFGMGIVLGSETIADYAGSVYYARLGNIFLQRYQSIPGSGFAKFIYANFAARWELPLKKLFPIFMEASQISMSQGNIGIAITSLYCMVQVKILAGEQLEKLVKEAQGYGNEAKKLSAVAEDKCLSVYREVAKCLTGLNPDHTHPIAIEFQEELNGVEEFDIASIHRAHYYMWCSILSFLFDDYEHVKSMSHYPKTLLEKYSGLHSTSMLLLTTSLGIAARISSENEDREGCKQIKTYLTILEKMGMAIPANYGPHMWLIKGELARLNGKPNEARKWYRKAVQTARDEVNPLLAGISYEVMARFYVWEEDEDQVLFHLEKAIRCYELIKAKAKVEHLRNHYEKYFPQVMENTMESTADLSFSQTTLTTIPSRTMQSTHTTTEESNIDLNTVIQASQSLSKEIDLNKLMEALMKLMIVNAGANKAVLIRIGNGLPMVFSEIKADSPYEPLKEPIPLSEKGEELCLNIVKYVIRTKIQVLLNNVEKDPGNFLNDPYFLWKKPKSILCFPLLQTNMIKGVLYLENTTAANAFTPSNLQLLSILSSQMMISLENAEFYEKLEAKVASRTEELNQRNEELAQSNTQLQTAMKHVQEVHERMIQQEKMASLGMLTAGIAHELKNPLNFVINFSQIAHDNIKELIEKTESKLNDEEKILIKEVLDNLSTIDVQGGRASKIIKEMLSQAHEGKGSLEEIQINDLIDEAAKLSYQAFKKKELQIRQVNFVKNYEGDLPIVMGFPGDLLRVFINIIDNACYAMYEKQKMAPESYIPTIEISTRLEAGRVVVVIKDNGTGIPQEMLDKIYNPFFTTKAAGVGTGLGLWICFDIITKKHAGTIEVRSSPGEMSIFEISFPAGPQ